MNVACNKDMISRIRNGDIQLFLLDTESHSIFRSIMASSSSADLHEALRHSNPGTVGNLLGSGVLSSSVIVPKKASDFDDLPISYLDQVINGACSDDPFSICNLEALLTYPGGCNLRMTLFPEWSMLMFAAVKSPKIFWQIYKANPDINHMNARGHSIVCVLCHPVHIEYEGVSLIEVADFVFSRFSNATFLSSQCELARSRLEARMSSHLAFYEPAYENYTRLVRYIARINPS